MCPGAWPRSRCLEAVGSAWERTKIISTKYAPVSAAAENSPFGVRERSGEGSEGGTRRGSSEREGSATQK